MTQITAPTALFALLDFCGIRPREIMAHLGVSKALVSLWRSGHRQCTPKHVSALILYAANVFFATRVQVPTPEAHAGYRAFEAHLHAALVEDDPTPLAQRLLAVRTAHQRTGQD